MIEASALAMAKFFASKKIYDSDQVAIYQYGFELVLSTAANMICVAVFALLTDTFSGAVGFCIAFALLRTSAGGYHARHHWSCILTFSATYLGFVLILRGIQPWMGAFIVIVAALSFSLVVALAPVAAVNKPLIVAKAKQQRKRSIILAGINFGLAIVAVTVIQVPWFMAFYTSGTFAASLSLVAAKAVVYFS